MLYEKICLSIIFVLKCSAEIPKIDRSFLLTPERLPNDLRFMPSLSNGHFGFTVLGDAIYLNGVYNGRKGNSRRARLPNWLNITAHIYDEQMKTYLQYESIKSEMNLYKGVYKWVEIYESLNVTVKQRLYAHRFFNRAAIYEVAVHRENASEPMNIQLNRNPGPYSKAFDFKTENSNNSNIKLIQATTREVENELFQPEQIKVFIALSDDFSNNKKIFQMKSGQNIFHYRFVLAADVEREVALKEMEAVLNLTSAHLLSKHSAVWQEFWKNFQIKVEGDEELSQTINAGIFYMTNSLPSMKTYQKNNRYYGLSPTGLGRGELDDDYEGHNFWDTEIWMLPIVTMFDAFWSQELFMYRLRHLRGAIHNANITGFKGSRFPWESAFTGTEVTNPCCPEVAVQEVHISADIAVALQQYYASINSREWLCRTAWPLVREIAKFLQSRVTWHKQTQKFHVLDVMGPDEDHENVDDNVFTNVVFKYALKFARFTHLECEPDTNLPSLEWLNISNNLFILYDEEKDYHPQHFGYRPGDKVKQADTILLGYPLQYHMKNSTRYNDLRTYENATRSSGPAMTWSMFSINYLDIGLLTKAQEYFRKSYKNYVRPEFKVWSETEIGLKGSANFLTGVGGFLQAIVYGFGGIRFQLVNNTGKMLIQKTCLISATRKLTITGVKFSGSTFELVAGEANKNTLQLSKLGTQKLEIIVGINNDPFDLYEGILIHFQTELLTITTKT